MGSLHDGHLSLLRKAQSESDQVVVSIFVNPAQFGSSKDFRCYPRNEQRDLDLLAKEGVEIVFVPKADEVYRPGFSEWVEVRSPIVQRLEGISRPNHFRGVTTIVSILFEIVCPDRAYFGEKDAQQLLVIKQLTSDLELPVKIIGCPTVREASGLAISSRNVHLSKGEKKAALAIPRALALIERLVAVDGLTEADLLKKKAEEILHREPSLEVDYLSIVDEKTLEELVVVERPALALAAVCIGDTRLIDSNGI